MADASTIVRLDYGTEGIPLSTHGLNSTVLRPKYLTALPDEHAAFIKAVRRPYGTDRLAALLKPGEKVAIVIPDITRALPGDRLLPWLLAEISHIPRRDVTLIVGTGTHRGNTPEELARMVGSEVASKYRIVNSDSRDNSSLLSVGRSPFGYEVQYHKNYVQADRRILVGFIEPHFMAGFSGGYKAVFPGIANLDAILHYHNFANIAHPLSTWGELDGNPTQAHVRAAGMLLPVDFLVNVTLNTERSITGYFCGEVMAAHLAGCAFSKEVAMAGVPEAFPIVVTTNSGYPLDLNLYQTVKGMVAAHAIARAGGLIITAARCNDGFPEHGKFKDQLLRWPSPAAAWASICNGEAKEVDLWQTQKLLQVVRHCRVQLYSELDSSLVERAHLVPIQDVRQAIDTELARLGAPTAPVAILPEGPLTIPYVCTSTVQ